MSKNEFISKEGVDSTKKLILLKILYVNEHNSRVIGDFWEYHREFADFIIKNTSPPPKKKVY